MKDNPVVPLESHSFYKLSKTGATQEFRVSLYSSDNPDSFEVFTVKGLLGGEQQIDRYLITSGKNLGRANETTPYEQAKIKINTICNKLRDKGYLEISSATRDTDTIGKIITAHQGKDASGNLKPMLAYKTIQHIRFPALVQRKYDGVRCFCRWSADNKIHLTSRNGKEFLYLGHIAKDLQHSLKPDEILDGELYHHTLGFQAIVSAVKREQALNSEIQLRAYDVAVPEVKQERRIRRLKTLVKHSGNSIHYCPTYLVNSLDEALKFFSEFIAEGYEGMMLRNLDATYEFGVRSKYLAKYKEFDEEEFKIIAVHEAEGRDAGTAILECVCKGGNFRCRPMGDRSLRAAYLRDSDDLIGKKVTVKYQGLSTDGIPRFPIAKCIRDFE